MFNYYKGGVEMKKSNFGLLTEFMLAVAVVTIVAILVFNVNEDARDDLTINSAGYNATLDSDTAVGKIPSNLGLLATAVVFGVILYVILRVVPNMGGRGSF